MHLTTVNDVVRSLRRVGPLVREYSGESERDRHPSAAAMDALIHAGMFRLMTPQAFDGLELDPLTIASVIEDISSYDSVAGWTVAAANSVDWWTARLPAEGAEEIYSGNADAIVAAAFQPPLEAVAVDGGYRVRGSGPLACNVHDAGWLLLTAIMMDGEQPRMVDGVPVAIGAVVSAQEAVIANTWYALGGWDAESSDVFVPETRTFPITSGVVSNRHARGPLYRLPALADVSILLAPVALAIARNACIDMNGLLQTHRGQDGVKSSLDRADDLLRQARRHYYDALEDAWQRVLDGEPSTFEQQSGLLMAASQVLTSTENAVRLLRDANEKYATSDNSRIERHFRDVHTIRHRGFISEDSTEAVGRVYLGAPLELALAMF